MGCCTSDENDRMIGKKMQEQQAYNDSLNKLLFLGPGASGKSTIFKQLQWLHGDGYDEAQRDSLKQHITSQIVSQMQDAIKEYLSSPCDDETLQTHIDKVRDHEAKPELDPDIAESITYIYKNDDRLKNIFKTHHKKKVLDETTEYFWNAMDRITDSEYMPTKQDIINIRYRTTGIIEKEFEIKSTRFHIFDVGGQKSERKKWIRCFGDVKAIVFVVSLACFNEVMFEDETKNCMDDALELFDDTINKKIFAETPIILFLNKKDLFEMKIKDLAITECPSFDDYDGSDPHDYEETIAYIQRKFEHINEYHGTRSIYCHHTCAMDDENVKNVFNDVTRIMLQEVRKAMSRNNLL